MKVIRTLGRRKVVPGDEVRLANGETATYVAVAGAGRKVSICGPDGVIRQVPVTSVGLEVKR